MAQRGIVINTVNDNPVITARQASSVSLISECANDSPMSYMLLDLDQETKKLHPEAVYVKIK